MKVKTLKEVKLVILIQWQTARLLFIITVIKRGVYITHLTLA